MFEFYLNCHIWLCIILCLSMHQQLPKAEALPPALPRVKHTHYRTHVMKLRNWNTHHKKKRRTCVSECIIVQNIWIWLVHHFPPFFFLVFFLGCCCGFARGEVVASGVLGLQAPGRRRRERGENYWRLIWWYSMCYIVAGNINQTVREAVFIS